MSAGLPLLVVSVLSIAIVVVWIARGPGPSLGRRMIGGAIAVALALCWTLLLYFGPFNSVGGLSMGIAFVIAGLSFFVPVLWRIAIRKRERQQGAT